MTPGSRPMVRIAVVALAVLVVTPGVSALTTPATAASAPLSYACDFEELGTDVVTAEVGTDAPSSLTYGQTVPLQISSVMDIPAEVVTLLGDGAAWVDGTADATVIVDGVARQAALTIPRTAASGDPVVLSGAGPGGTITPGPTLPTVELGAGAFTLTLKGYNSSEVPTGSATIPCALQPGQDAHVGTVTVLKAASTTSVSVQPVSVAYGASAAVSAEVAQPGASAKPGGTVTFAFDGLTVSAPVHGGKASVDLLPAFSIGLNAVSATFTPSVPNLAPSQGSTNLVVVRDDTTTRAGAIYRDARDRLVAKAKVVADHDAGVAGAVRLVLKREGVRIRTAKVGLNQFGKARKAFQDVTRPGRYTVVTRYLGSATFKRSADRARVTV